MKVAIANHVSGHPNMFWMDKLMQKWLEHFGYETEFLTCDSNLSACLRLKHTVGMLPIDISTGNWKSSKSACQKCRANSNTFANAKVIEINPLSHSEAVLMSDWEEHTYRDIPIGEHARSNVHRYFAKGLLDYKNNEVKITYAMFLKAAIETTDAYFEYFEISKPDIVLAHHGIYVPQGVIVDVAKRLGIQVATWNFGYRKGSILVVHGDSYHKIMPAITRQAIETMQLTDAHRELGEAYLKSRVIGKADWINYQHQVNEIHSPVDRSNSSKLDYDFLILTNVAWDAKAHFKDGIFEDQHEWLTQTINYLSQKKLRVGIRVHPGEVLGSTISRESLGDYCKNLVDKLDGLCQFEIFNAENPVSTYGLIARSKCCLVFASKIALEASYCGKRVVIAGEAWVKSKGLALEPKDPKSYFEVIDEILSSTEEPDKEQLRLLAADFAFLLFYEEAPSPLSLERIKTIDSTAIEEIYYKQSSSEMNNDIEIKRLVEKIVYNRRSVTISPDIVKEKLRNLNNDFE